MRSFDLLSQPTRFARWPAIPAALVLLLLALLIAGGVLGASGSIGERSLEAVAVTGPAGAPTGSDAALYGAMADAVRHGGDYYANTARLMRDHHYPLRPFVTMRLPTLTLLLAMLPPGLAIVPMALLLGAVIIAWTMRLGPAVRTPGIRSCAALFIMIACMIGFSPVLVVFHEFWAALLVALALALYRAERWWPSVALALLAVLIRELAFPLVVVMGGLALLDRRWREAAGWGVVALVFAITLCLHAQAVGRVTSALDPASPGWGAHGGWLFVVGAVQKATLFGQLPIPLVPVLMPLALLGWSAWRSPTGIRTALFLGGFTVGMMLFGRPDNFYWAVMMTPLLFVGLLFAPAALRDLFGRAAELLLFPSRRIA